MPTATVTCPLPTPEEVASLLGDLLGKEATATAVQPRLRPLHLLAIAAYTSEDGDLMAACLCDLPLAASAGAALALVPAAVAQQSLDTRTLSPHLAENLQEVLNVASRWVNGDGSPRLVLDRLVVPGDAVPGEVRALLGGATARVDCSVEIEGYPGGLLTIVNR